MVLTFTSVQPLGDTEPSKVLWIENPSTASVWRHHSVLLKKKSSQYFNDLAVISLFTYTCNFPPAILSELGSSRCYFFAVISWCCSYVFIIIVICLQANIAILVTPTLNACLTDRSRPLSQEYPTLLNLFHEMVLYISLPPFIKPLCIISTDLYFSVTAMARSCLSADFYSSVRQRSILQNLF